MSPSTTSHILPALAGWAGDAARSLGLPWQGRMISSPSMTTKQLPGFPEPPAFGGRDGFSPGAPVHSRSTVRPDTTTSHNRARCLAERPALCGAPTVTSAAAALAEGAALGAWAALAGGAATEVVGAEVAMAAVAALGLVEAAGAGEVVAAPCPVHAHTNPTQATQRIRSSLPQTAATLRY